jgi:hypothetical protein
MCRRRSSHRRGQPFQTAEVFQDRADLFARVETALLRQVAEPIAILRAERMTENLDSPAVRLDDVQNRANQRGLAGAVGTEQSEDLALMDFDRHVVERDDLIEPLAHADDADRNSGHRRPALMKTRRLNAETAESAETIQCSLRAPR